MTGPKSPDHVAPLWLPKGACVCHLLGAEGKMRGSRAREETQDCIELNPGSALPGAVFSPVKGVCSCLPHLG